MAIALRGSITTTTGNHDVTINVALNKPTGVVDGDLLYVFIQTMRTVTFTPPADWVLVDSDAATNNSHLFRKVAASEGSTFTFSASVTASTTYIGMCIALYDTAGAGSPTQDVYTETIDSTADTTADNTGVTPTSSPGGMLLAFIGSPNVLTSYSAYAIATGNPSWTEGVDTSANIDTRTCSAALAYASRDSVAATGDFSATIADSAATTVYLIAVKPAGYSIASPLSTISVLGLASTSALSVAMPLGSMVLSGLAPSVSEADPLWATASKNTASAANTSKNAATASNTSKNSASWSNTQKS